MLKSKRQQSKAYAFAVARGLDTRTRHAPSQTPPLGLFLPLHHIFISNQTPRGLDGIANLLAHVATAWAGHGNDSGRLLIA